MKVPLLGGGVIRCTAACEPASDGHGVTLVERQPGPALETSDANAGEPPASPTTNACRAR